MTKIILLGDNSFFLLLENEPVAGDRCYIPVTPLDLQAHAPTCEITAFDGEVISEIPTAVLLTSEHGPSVRLTEPIQESEGWSEYKLPKRRKQPKKGKIPVARLWIEAGAPTARLSQNITSQLPKATARCTGIGFDADLDYDEARMLEEAELFLTVMRWRNRDAMFA